MKRITLPTALLTMLAMGMVANTSGCTGKRRGGEAAAEEGSAGKFVTMDDVDDSLNDKVEGERLRVQYDPETDAVKGAANPLVTIVEYSDFQCPYCSKLGNTLDEVAEAYPDDVRLVFKHFPLPMHKDAPLGSQATLAAKEQGKFWEMHDKLFANQRAMTRADVEKYAEEIGLDMNKFKAALDSGKYKEQVDADLEAGRGLGVRSTPTFFVNGKLQRGALPVDAVKKMVEEEKKAAQKLIEAGSKREEVYARILKAAKEKAPPPEPKKPQQRPGQPDPSANYAVPTGDNRPVWGKDSAVVTIVEFSDFECPFCSRVNPTLKQVKENFANDVRIIFRQLPLPFHKNAKPAAKAALAAHKQGKYWAMHDKLFANQKALTPENFKTWAKEIGLDVAKFEKDMNDPALDKWIAEDMAAANKFGARGTPAFFVNGRFVSGAQPYPNFEKVIQEELKKAKAASAKHGGATGEELYAAMAKGWETEIKQPPIADHKRRKLATEGLPRKGKGNKVTIVECSDFDCPFCKRATATVDQIEKEYGDKVSIYFRQYPLPMHKNAESAHRAALAAEKQGKFWEMHDKLFENQKARTEEDFKKYAQEIGLNVAKFEKDFSDPGLAKQVQEDIKVCQGLDVRGAPGFLINGRLLSGARPYPQFKAVIEEELAGGFEKKGG